jgi:hypothetical protein
MCWLYSDEWAAGFFDGEGSVSIFREARGGYVEHRVVVQLTQNDQRPLHAVRERFGGTVSRGTANPRCSRWRVDGGDAERFMRAVLPHSLVKREKLQLALAMRDLIGTPGRRLPTGVLAAREAIYDRFYR